MTIFDGKPIDEISDEEIDALVAKKEGERQHLEFKVTVNYRDENEKLELLRDVASLANGGGGYLIVGIRADDRGNAVRYEPKSVGDTEAIRKSILQLCHEHISDRIYGLEALSRTVRGNPIVIVRVPASARVPHMVKMGRRTDFYSRYQDGKREMTLAEIREAFTEDVVGIRLGRIEAGLLRLSETAEKEREKAAIQERVKSATLPQLLTTGKWDVLQDCVLKRFVEAVGHNRYFWICVTPLSLRANAIDLDSVEIRQLVEFPPGSRPHGWSMDLSRYAPVQRFAEGLLRGKKDYIYLELLQNGHMEFWKPLDEAFCWRQSPKDFQNRPRLYPFAVTEFPTTFLRLYRAIVDKAKLDGDFAIKLHYRNLRGCCISQYLPGTWGFEDPEANAVRTFDHEHLDLPPKQVRNDFRPDEIAYELIGQVYTYFGLMPALVPYYDPKEKRFTAF